MKKKYFISGIILIFLAAFVVHTKYARARMNFIYPGLPQYPGSESVNVGDNMRIDGRSIKIHCLKTKDSPRQVINFYASRWKNKKWPVIKKMNSAVGSMVSVIKGSYLLTVVVQRVEQERFSLVFPSRTKISQKPVERQMKGIPVYPGSQSSLHLESEDDDDNADTFVSYNNGSLMSNISFYQSRMLGAGWKHQVMPVSDQVRTVKLLFFSKGKRECSISIQQRQNGMGSMVMINHIERT